MREYVDGAMKEGRAVMDSLMEQRVSPSEKRVIMMSPSGKPSKSATS